MHQYPFIFSDGRKMRMRRHFLFWASWWLFSAFLYSFSAPAQQIPYFQRFPMSCLESLFYLIPHMFLAYSLMYKVVPQLLLKGRYTATLVSVIFLFLVTAAISTVISVYILANLRDLLSVEAALRPRHISEVNFFYGLMAGLRGAITIGGMAAAIKLMKHLYMKEQRNLQLQKQNMEVQLQLLKAQVHPHFLFNTMNNIYSNTQDTAPDAARMVAGLSDMLRYMLYEGAQPVVPLQKELKMLQDYMLLEAARYDSGLEINLQLPEESGNLYIAPLLLLPLVENCFKHGTSHMLEQPWISLHMHIEQNWLHLKLVNGKAVGYEPPKTAAGIGLSNVRKRLELLYPQKHELKVTNEEDVFILDLKLELQKRPAAELAPSTAKQLADA